MINKIPYFLLKTITVIILLSGCSGGEKNVKTPRTDLKPFKEISAIELFEKVFSEHGYKTLRNKTIYIAGYGPWQVDLWVEGEKLPLVVEYLKEEDREKLGEHLKSSKVGEKFKLVAVATEEISEGTELNRSNSRFAVIFDDRDYVYQPNPKSEDRYEVTIFEIEKRLKIDITDVIEELERIMAKEKEEEASQQEEN